MTTAHPPSDYPENGAASDDEIDSGIGDLSAEGSLDEALLRIASLEADLRETKASYLRALADLENTKRLADKRIEDNRLYAVSNFAKEILSVADNLGRALLAAPAETRRANETVATLAVGIEMTEKELLNALGKYAVRKVESLNRPFDPHVHQAVQEVDKNDVPTGTVVQVYQDGFLISDRLLRPAMVVVSRGGPKRVSSEEGPVEGAAPGTIDRSI